MYLRITTLTKNSILIDSGDGPRVLGQTMNNAWYRVASSLLSAIGSSVPDSLVAIISDMPVGDLPNPWCIRGGGSIDEISLETARTTEHSGWIPRVGDKPGAIFLLYDREDIEDGIYETFGHNFCYLVPDMIRRHAKTFDDLEHQIKKLALCELDVTDNDVLLEFKDAAILNAVISSTARVVMDFNQQ